MRLNLGCGHNQLAGYVNVDLSPVCEPDLVFDLNATPWPWPESSVEEMVFHHSLEHLGAETAVFLAIMGEIWPVGAPDALVRIEVPHPRHDNFIGDPTHVRIISPQVLSLFDRELNDEWKRTGAANTPLAHYLGIDLKIEAVETVLSEPFGSRYRGGQISQAELIEALNTRNNVAEAFKIRLRVRKAPA